MKQLLIDIRIVRGLEINDSIWRGYVIIFHKSHAVRACFERQRGRRFCFVNRRLFGTAALLAQKRILHRFPMKQNFCSPGLNTWKPASLTPRKNRPA
jgi:hypothetical protein